MSDDVRMLLKNLTYGPSEATKLSKFCLDIAQTWEEWIKQIKLFITAKELDEKPDKVKVAVMLSAMSPDEIARYNQFTWTKADDKDKFDSVVQKFENQLKGEKRGFFN